MQTLGKQILLALVMGVVLPGLILSLLGRPEKDIPDNTEVTEETIESNTVSLQILQQTIPILQPDGSVEPSNLEVYICGVVLAEMPADFPVEALKAQSVVARTYALRRMENGTKHPLGAVCTAASCCQGYITPSDFLEKGGRKTDIQRVQKSVYSTAGQVLTYQEELIDATYFSCSGGMTEDAVAVWGSDVPYLQSTESPGEEAAAHFTDTVQFTPGEVAEALGVSLESEPEEWFSILSRTDGGGVDKLRAGEKTFSGVEVRKLLQLRSTNFTISATEEYITIQTSGYGHRVGMSQYGAQAMALAGNTYEEILSHYYCSTELSQYCEPQ